jgi:transcriptional regulator with XRE-family HTH domain
VSSDPSAGVFSERVEATSFGRRLRARRRQLDLSQQQLGEALGYTQTAISYWESESRGPSIADLARLAEVLDVSLDYLILGREAVLRAAESPPDPQLIQTLKSAADFLYEQGVGEGAVAVDAAVKLLRGEGGPVTRGEEKRDGE